MSNIQSIVLSKRKSAPEFAAILREISDQRFGGLIRVEVLTQGHGGVEVFSGGVDSASETRAVNHFELWRKGASSRTFAGKVYDGIPDVSFWIFRTFVAELAADPGAVWRDEGSPEALRPNRDEKRTFQDWYRVATPGPGHRDGWDAIVECTRRRDPALADFLKLKLSTEAPPSVDLPPAPTEG